MQRKTLILLLAFASIMATTPLAHAQLLAPVKQSVEGVADILHHSLAPHIEAQPLTRPLTTLARLRNLLRIHPRLIEADRQGYPVVRGEVIAIAPDATALARAHLAGFASIRSETIEGLGVDIVTLAPPPDMPVRKALEVLRRTDPEGVYDLNHIYAGAGENNPAPTGLPARGTGGTPRIGLIDTGVAAHPSITGSIVEQRAFAPGGLQAGTHGTAVASLLVGHHGTFRGAAPGLRLLVADVYGKGPTGGSAEAIARALGWMAARQVPIINVSLVGPPNLLMRTAIAAMNRRGQLIVAAVGNDGPAAPPLYPAAYPGVIAVTGVDARNRVLIEAGRGSHVDFAAPGSDMVAATAAGGWRRVRGTSFAAPLVAGRLALAMPPANGGTQAVETVYRQAADLGRRGPDTIYGHGLVCGECRNILK